MLSFTATTPVLLLSLFHSAMIGTSAQHTLSQPAQAVYNAVYAQTQQAPHSSPYPLSSLAASASLLDIMLDYGDTDAFCEHGFRRLILSARQEVLMTSLMFAKNTITADCVIKAVKDLDQAAAREGRRVRVYLAVDPTGAVAFNRQVPPLRSLFNKRHQVSPTHYDLPDPKDLKAVDLVFKTYHKNILGVLHPKQVLVDGKWAMAGSKNIDADKPEEMMLVLEGESFVDACRRDFEDIWGEPLPALTVDANSQLLGQTASNSELLPTPQVPIVMMGRVEDGGLLSRDWRAPQNIGWMTMMDVAEKEVYIHTMLFNAVQLFDKVIETVKRGIDVNMVLTYKYAEAALSTDRRGYTTNRNAVEELYKALKNYPEARRRLNVCWWVGLRQQNDKRPRPKAGDFTHAKAIIIDRKMVAVGSANMDTISVYNQREANFLMDDESIANLIYDRLTANRLVSPKFCHNKST